MSLTVRQVAALPELALTVRSGSAHLEREVRWVAVSEQLDPRPWIDAGDLVLTTGMAIVDEGRTCRDYVDRLMAAEVAGLGFGVGLGHTSIPEGLVDAADAAGLPLLEVPEPVPFVAVGKAVSRHLAMEEYADAASSFEAQRRMIRAVLGDGDSEASVLSSLARHVGGFALHLDPAGAPLAAHPADASGRAADLFDEIDRLRPRGLLASSAISTADEHIVIVPIGTKGAAAGFLVVGSPRPLRSADQSVMNLAVSLLSLGVGRMQAAGASMDPWRRLLIDQALEHGLDPGVLDSVGLAGLDPGQSVAVTIRGAGDAAVAAAATLQHSGQAVLAGRGNGEASGFVGIGADGMLPAALRAASSSPDIVTIGVSRVLDLSRPANVRQAVDQADRAARLGSGLRTFDDEPTRSLATLLDAATTEVWARAYLARLIDAAEGQELMGTLQAWLSQHGLVDAAAQQLGIHRHTVRHRLRRAEALLERPLDDASVRADLWFALQSVRGAGSDARNPE